MELLAGSVTAVAAGEARFAAWDGRMTARLRALLHAGPLLKLNDLERFLPEGAAHYDLLALALAVFDAVIENSGLDGETDAVTLVASLAPFLAAMDHAAGVEPDQARHRSVAERVLAHLRNDADRRRPFRVQYTTFDQQGRAATREIRMRLLEDRHHPDGRVVLALSTGAANLFLRALDLDIEDSQIATEAIVRTQLERGKFDRAASAAAEARLLSIRYRDKIERVIRDTRRNLRRVDWGGEVRRLLDDALGHLTHQLIAEQAIRSVADERLETLEPGSDPARSVARVRDLIAECERRHVQLHRPVMTARAVFLDEQERQAFTRPRGGTLPHLEGDVLIPLMRMDARGAAAVLDGAVPSLVGPVPPGAFRLKEMVMWLLQPRREAMPGEVERAPRELVDPDPLPERFGPEVRARAGARLQALGVPRPLSAVLAEAAGEGEPREVLECLALLSLRLFGPAGEAAFGLRAVRTDERLEVAGISGDELILLPIGSPDA
ncbi:MAG TPA: hypothetical protein VGB15_19035 [Longimicrobium sp.]|jgi:hypothetical protein